jgi:hypothetical protein
METDEDQADEGDEQRVKRADILVDNFKTALRIGERYLFISLATAALAVAGKLATSKDQNIDFSFVLAHMEIRAPIVTLVAVAISWFAAWLCWNYVRHAARLAGVIHDPAAKLDYDTAIIALTYPSLFTMKGAWFRWLIVVAMGGLLYGSIVQTFGSPVGLEVVLWPIVAVVELPFLLLLFFSGIKFRSTERNAILSMLSRLRSGRLRTGKPGNESPSSPAATTSSTRSLAR